MAYATKEDFKGYVPNGIVLDEDDDDLIEAVLTAASDQVDTIANQSFEEAPVEPYARVYNAANDGRYIYLDKFVGDVVSVELDGEPVEFAVKQDKHGNKWLKGHFRIGEDYEVTARWGWEATPSTVKVATLMVASKLWERRKSPYGLQGIDELGVMRVTGLDADVKHLLGKYVKVSFG